MTKVDATPALIAALVKILNNDETIKENLGHNIVCQDEQVEFPMTDNYKILFSAAKSNAWHSATFEGQEHEITFQLFSSSIDTMEATKAAAVIIDRLHNADFPVAGHALVDLQFEASVTRFVESIRVYRTDITFKGLTVSD